MRSPEPLPPSPFVTPEENRYKNSERPSIEGLIKREFGSPERLRSSAAQFLVTDPTLLTEEELIKFKIFADHGAKRILNAQSQKDGGIKMKLFLTKIGIPVEYSLAFPVLFHDLSHIAGSIILERHTRGNKSIVPPVFKFKHGNDTNRHELFADELYGILWDKIAHEETPSNYTMACLKKAKTLQDFIDSYVNGVLEASLNENTGVLESHAEHTKPIDQIDEYLDEKEYEAEELADDIRKNPPDEIIRLLTYVWNHRDNPRVMADLFFKEITPYIEGLRKRKVYRPKTV